MNKRNLVIIGLIIVGLGASLVWLARSRRAPAPSPATETVRLNKAAAAAARVGAALAETLKTDADLDGLNDTEENKLGTNSALVDSDGDGLNDWAEVKLFHTNPLAPDTDGDGLNDGTEVVRGQNPAGAGLLRPPNFSTSSPA